MLLAADRTGLVCLYQYRNLRVTRIRMPTLVPRTVNPGEGEIAIRACLSVLCAIDSHSLVSCSTELCGIGIIELRWEQLVIFLDLGHHREAYS